MSEPIQSLTEIAERCRATAKACNPSKIPIAIDDIADLADIVAKLVIRIESQSDVPLSKGNP